MFKIVTFKTIFIKIVLQVHLFTLSGRMKLIIRLVHMLF